MSFSFGFFDNQSTDQPSSCVAPAPEKCSLGDNNAVMGMEVKDHPIGQQLVDVMKREGLIYSTINVAGKQFNRKFKTNESDLDRDSDIISGVYEGGYKIWESSVDLASYILTNADSMNLSQSSVLELGCGHGLPGLAALHMGCKHITFSDLNAEVIDNVLLYNILLNDHDFLIAIDSEDHEIDDRTGRVLRQVQDTVSCFSGDWIALSDYFGDARKFDLILSAETIYSSESCFKVSYSNLLHIDTRHHGRLIYSNCCS